MSPFSNTPSSGLAVSANELMSESGVSDKGDIQNVQGRGACRTGLKTTAVMQYISNTYIFWLDDDISLCYVLISM